MDLPLLLIELAGAVALLLWGVRMVQTGVQRAFGPRLRALLAAALRTRWRAFLAGIGVTAVLQSSTATGLMVTGFAAGGVVALEPALAVMLGANLGTTLIVQALSFDVARLAPALIALGFLMFRRGEATRSRDIGRVIIGLGLMLMALHQLLAAITPYEASPALRQVLSVIGAEPLVAMLLAALLSWAAHSSVAVVLLVMSLAARGIAPPEVALVLVVGANLGTAINPVLEGGAGDDPVARRLPLGNLLNRLVGSGLALLAIPALTPLLMGFQPQPARAVADFHTMFNLVLAALFFPLLPALAQLLRRLLPARIDPADPSRPLYLDQAALETPVVAIGAAAREALRLTDVLDTMLQGLREGFERDDRRGIAESRRLDDVVDRLNAAIQSYTSALEPEAMTDADLRRVAEILAFCTGLEHAGDVIDRNLSALASRRLKRGLALSAEERAELAALFDRLEANLRTAAAVFMSGDLRAARLLAGEKEVFRDLEEATTQAHFARLRDGLADASATGALHLDVVRDLKRVNAHLVEAAAYPVLKAEGELLPSRLREG